MSKISSRIGTHTVASSFEGKQITFSRNGKIHKKIENIWFVYFQRVSKSLKSCDAVFFNGTELVEFVIAQDDIGKIIIADNWSFIAVKTNVAREALHKIENGKIKGRSFRVRRLRG